jgi:hypothetical protein
MVICLARPSAAARLRDVLKAGGHWLPLVLRGAPRSQGGRGTRVPRRGAASGEPEPPGAVPERAAAAVRTAAAGAGASVGIPISSHAAPRVRLGRAAKDLYCMGYGSLQEA